MPSVSVITPGSKNAVAMQCTIAAMWFTKALRGRPGIRSCSHTCTRTQARKEGGTFHSTYAVKADENAICSCCFDCCDANHLFSCFGRANAINSFKFSPDLKAACGCDERWIGERIIRGRGAIVPKPFTSPGSRRWVERSCRRSRRRRENSCRCSRIESCCRWIESCSSRRRRVEIRCSCRRWVETCIIIDGPKFGILVRHRCCLCSCCCWRVVEGGEEKE